MWKETLNGVVDLVSPELNGVVLSEDYCNSMSGAVYKHFDDLMRRKVTGLYSYEKG
ncbi:hypothetical protein QTV49_000404 [Vibrio vulnificus]|nr:hypothetical protein [Vibrio vulnificus]